jgi:uncharacterized protein YjgD (DUF1641 family)
MDNIMANTEGKITKTSTSQSTQKKADIANLEKKVVEQQAQIEELMKIIQNSMNIVTASNSSDEINADEDILVVSLTPNKLNLVGSDGSTLFSFDSMYEEQYIDYASLKEIVRVNRDMAKNGRFYILDEKAVNKLRLKNNYKTVLTPEQMKKILSSNTEHAIELFKLANATQQKIIVDMVIQAKFRGDNVDYNLLRELGELSGVNLIDAEDATQIEK